MEGWWLDCQYLPMTHGCINDYWTLLWEWKKKLVKHIFFFRKYLVIAIQFCFWGLNGRNIIGCPYAQALFSWLAHEKWTAPNIWIHFCTCIFKMACSKGKKWFYCSTNVWSLWAYSPNNYNYLFNEQLNQTFLFWPLYFTILKIHW